MQKKLASAVAGRADVRRVGLPETCNSAKLLSGTQVASRTLVRHLIWMLALATAAQAAPRWQNRLARLSALARQSHLPEVAFERNRLLGSIHLGYETYLGHDKAQGAIDPSEDVSKFVLIRDFAARKAVEMERRWQREHVLAIATPRGGQPTHLLDVDPAYAHHLGRMVRTVLSMDQMHGPARQFGRWTASASLPGRVIIPFLHVHGEQFAGPATIDSASVRDWPSFVAGARYQSVVKRGDYEIFARPYGLGPSGWDVIAIAAARFGTPKTINTSHDALLGQMFLELGQIALDPAREQTAGHIELARDDSQIVLRAVNYDSTDLRPFFEKEE